MERLDSSHIMTAIKTPYLSNGQIDLNTYDSLVEQQIQGGVQGLIVGGTTGEGHLMSWDEHIMLIAHSVHCFGDQLVIVGNTGSNNTREALHATGQGFAVGMHASLQINPYYGKTSEDGLRAHFQRVFDLGPAIVYNVPSRTGQDLQPGLMEDLAQHENFMGIKECMGPERIAHYSKKGIRCWSGNDDDSFHSRHDCGGHGVISVTSNVVPKLMRLLMETEDAQLNEKLHSLMSWLFCEPNPVALNTALSMLGAVSPVFRLPYVPLNLERRKIGMELLQAIEPENRVGDRLQLMEDSDFILI
ncbi:MAG: 4-hydroxy-tetrahydrodipicolinate synthase [SAR324 cluster bacterium]|nr:4-hydroxy-tetrahydrodipicolinate synthase [SAR324 cluster bacterium]